MWWLIGLLILWSAAGVAVTYYGARTRRYPAHGITIATDRRIASLGQVTTLSIRASAPDMSAEKAPLDVVLILDRSSSMGSGTGSPFEAMIGAVCQFLGVLPPQFNSAVVAFDSSAQIIAPLSSDHANKQPIIHALTTGGTTSIADALAKAGEALRLSSGSRPAHLVLFTDGQDDAERTVEAAAKVRAERPDVALTCIAFGADADIDALGRLSDRTYHLKTSEEIAGLFDFLGLMITGKAPAAVTLECDVADPSPWKFVKDDDDSIVQEVRTGDIRTLRFSRPVFSSEPVVFRVRLEARCPGWQLALRAGRLNWRAEDGTTVSADLPASPRVLSLPDWLEIAFPLVNPLLDFWIRRQDCLAEEPEAEAAADPPIIEAKQFDALPERGTAPYRPTVKPTLFISLGNYGREVLEDIYRRLRDRDIEPSRAPAISIEIGESHADTDSPQWHVVRLAVDARSWIENAAASGVSPVRAFVPVERWLADNEVLHTYFGAGDNRALARLALLLAPQASEAAIASAAASAQPPIEQILLLMDASDAAAGGMAIEVAHMCAPLQVPLYVFLSPSRRFVSDRGPEAALAVELDRVLVCRGETVVSDRGERETTAQRFLDAVVVAGDRHAEAEENRVSLVEGAWSVFAYPAFKRELDVAARNGCARLRIEARSAPRRLLWEAVRERAVGDLIRSWVLGSDEPKASVERERARAEAATRLFWSGGGKLPAYPPHLQVMAALNAPGGVTADSMPASVGRARAGAPEAFARYLVAWLKTNFLDRAQDGWPLSALLLALRKVEEQMQATAAAFADGANRSDRPADWLAVSDAAQHYRDTVAGVADRLSRWHGTLIGEAWPGEDGPQFDGGLCGGAAEAAALRFDVILSALPAQAATVLETRYVEWIAQTVPAMLDRVGFWIAGGDGIDIRLLGPESELVPLDRVEQALFGWLDAFSAPVYTWLDDVAMRPFADNLRGTSIGTRAERLGGPAASDELRADPAYAAVAELTASPVAVALEVDGVDRKDLPYAWPEETNAARISHLYENVFGRQMPSLSGHAVSILRDPRRVLAMLLKLRDGAIVVRAGRVLEGSKDLGPAFEGPDAAVLFARTLRSAPAVADWPEVTQDPAAFAEALQDVPALRPLSASHDWEEWRAVVMGLVLDAQYERGRIGFSRSGPR